MGQGIIFRTKNGSTRATTLNLIGDTSRRKQKIFPEKNNPHSSCGSHLSWQGKDGNGNHTYVCRVCGKIHIKNK